MFCTIRNLDFELSSPIILVFYEKNTPSMFRALVITTAVLSFAHLSGLPIRVAYIKNKATFAAVRRAIIT